MPRTSDRQKKIKLVHDALCLRLALRIKRRNRFGVLRRRWSKVDVVLIMMLHHLETTRYSTPRKYRRRYNKSNGLTEFERDLQTGEGAWLTEEEFLQKYRMTRENLENLSELVKHHPTFQNTSGNKQAPPKYQIMLLLRYLGTEGSGTSNPNLRHTFRTGRGTCSLYRSRAVVAISSLRQQYIYWPDEEERKLWPRCS